MSAIGLDPALALLLLKMAVAAAVVVGCSLLAERSGPMVAAMIATLPISAGPVYAFLALDHDPAFIAATAGAGASANLANSGLVLAYVMLAQHRGTIVSLGAGLLAWFAIAVALRLVQPSFATVFIATPLVFGGLHLLMRPYLAARPKARVAPPWYAVPLRAACVAALAGTVTTVSSHVGAGWSGVLAALPIVLSSLIAILQPRIGGPAMAAVIANGAVGLMGLGVALGSIHLAAVALGSWPALGLGLAICIGWNLAWMWLSRRSGRAAP